MDNEQWTINNVLMRQYANEKKDIDIEQLMKKSTVGGQCGNKRLLFDFDFTC